MKKTLIASAITLAATAGTNANANIAVTSMNFSGIYAATGSINDDGTMGTFESVDDSFFGSAWAATQETAVITNSNGVTWAGSNALGSWDYAFDIANMTDNQVAVGSLWSWSSSHNDVSVLAVFDCTSDTTCIGQLFGADGNSFGGMQTGPTSGALPTFNGTGNLSAVPVPASAWLMGSGLLGLIGLARRKVKN